MEGKNNDLDFTGNQMEHVPGFGATPRYEVESLAGTTRVMNI